MHHTLNAPLHCLVKYTYANVPLGIVYIFAKY